jgi:hypothetical protein
VGGVRSRLLALATLVTLLMLVTGCGDESVPTTDPGHSPAAEMPTATASETPTETPTETPSASAAASPSPADLGRAFRAFARGGRLPPVADQVDLYLGNAFTGVVTRQQARDRAAWATCTETGSYATASCPLSPLTVLDQHAAVSYAAAPRGLCLATFGPVPPDLRKLDRTVIVPRRGSVDTCAKNFAVQLFADDGGRLVAVSTLLGEP